MKISLIIAVVGLIMVGLAVSGSYFPIFGILMLIFGLIGVMADKPKIMVIKMSMKYRIIVVQTTTLADHDVEVQIEGEWKYSKAENAEGDAEALKKSLYYCNFKNIKIKVEGST